MNIGVYLGSHLPHEGGGFVFEETLIYGLLNTKTKNRYIVLHTESSEFTSNDTILFVRLTKSNLYKIYKKIINLVNIIFLTRIPWIHLQTKSELNKAIKKNAIDIMWFPTPIYEDVDIPYIYTLWDLGHRLFPYFPEVGIQNNNWNKRESYYRKILPHASIIITGAEAGKKDIIDLFQIPSKTIKVVNLPVSSYVHNIPLYKSSHHSKLPKRYIFYPAQFWAHKNHIVLLLALKVLIDSSMDIHLVLTGSDKGNQSYIRKKVKELRLTKYVHFMGFVTQNDLIHIYKNAFALVFPSFFGPDNLPPLEAFSLQCPVLTSDIPGAKELFKDAALYFNPIDENDIVRALKHLDTQPSIRTKLIRAGLNRARTLTPERYVNEVDTIINDFGKYVRCWNNK